MKAKKITKPELEGDTYLIAQAVNHNAELLENALNRIKELEKQLKKEDVAGKPIGFEGFKPSEDMTREEAIEMLKKDKEQRGECFISDALDMAIKALKQEPVLDKIRAEIESQEKWLAEAGYNEYYVSVAFGAIKYALGKLERKWWKSM